MKNVRLGLRERWRAWREGQNAGEVLRMKNLWYRAAGTLDDYLRSDAPRILKIEYNPYYDDDTDIFIDWKKKELSFSAPSRHAPKDIYSSKDSRLGAAAHEYFHIIDPKIHYPQIISISAMYSAICSKDALADELRTNLLGAYVFPRAMYACITDNLIDMLQNSKISIANLREFKEPMIALEFLGRLGLERRDDVPEFLKEVKAQTGEPVETYIKKFWVPALAGLSIPPRLINETKYGVTKIKDLIALQEYVRQYVVGDIKTVDGIITRATDGYTPVNSINSKALFSEIIKESKAGNILDELESEISRWEGIASKHNGFYCFEDVARGLSEIERDIKEYALVI